MVGSFVSICFGFYFSWCPSTDAWGFGYYFLIGMILLIELFATVLVVVSGTIGFLLFWVSEALFISFFTYVDCCYTGLFCVISPTFSFIVLLFGNKFKGMGGGGWGLFWGGVTIVLFSVGGVILGFSNEKGLLLCAFIDEIGSSFLGFYPEYGFTMLFISSSLFLFLGFSVMFLDFY